MKKMIIGLFFVFGICIVGSGIAFASGYEKVTLQLGHVQSPEHHYQITAQAIADEVKEATGGNVIIQIYPSEQLGSGRDQVEAVKMNTQSMAFTPAGHIASYAPLFDILEMPYMVTTYEEAQTLIDSDVGKKFEQIAEEQGFVILGWCGNGYHNVTANKPIRVPADFRGLKVRVAISKIFSAMWAILDATPITLSMTETYTGLSHGTVDAQTNSTNNTIANKLYEVQKYFTLTRHTFVFQFILINKDLFYGFSPELQKLLRESVSKHAKKDFEMVKAEELDELALLEREGMTIIEPDVDAFKKAFEPIHERFSAENGQAWADLVAQIHNLFKK